MISVILAAAVLAGLSGCGKTPQSGMESSIDVSEPTSSAASVSLDRFEDEIIYNTELTREKLAKVSFSGKTSDTVYWAMHFVTQNYKTLSPHSIVIKYIDYKDRIESYYELLKNQRVYQFYTHIYLIRFKTLSAPVGLSMDKEGYYNIELQLVMEQNGDGIKLLGYVTSQTNQITSSEDLVEFLSVIPEYKEMQIKTYPPKSTVPETGWFGEGPIKNVAYTRASLSEYPVVSNDFYHPTIIDWIELYVKGNYNSSAYDTAYSEKFYTLETTSGEKEYFATIFCETNFQSDVVPEGFEIAKSSYQLRFQMVIKTGKNYYKEPYTLIGFVTNQERQIIEPRELYDFIKGVPRYKDTEFIVPEPFIVLELDSLGYDFTETKVDDASGLSVVNLRSLTGGLKVDDFEFFPGDLLAVLAVNPEVQNEKVLMVFNSDDLRLLYKKAFSVSEDGYVSFSYETLALVQKLDDKNSKYFIPTRTGISEISNPLGRYRLSDTSNIVKENENLYLEQNGERKLLLKGVSIEEDSDCEDFRFFCRISDTRFIYELMGYEWLVECGIYDIATGEKTVLTHKNAPLLNIETYADGKAILVADTWCGPEYESYGPYVYDELTRELIDLDLLNIKPSETMAEPRLRIFGNTLVLFTEDQHFSTFCLYDLSSRLYTLQFNILNAKESMREHSNYYSGLYTTENYIWFNSTHELPQDYLLRIPKKR